MRTHLVVLIAVASLVLGAVVVLAQQGAEPVGGIARIVTERSGTAMSPERTAQTIVTPRNVSPALEAPGAPRVVCGMTLIPVDPRIDPSMGTGKLTPVPPVVRQFAPAWPTPGGPSRPAPPAAPQTQPPGIEPGPPSAPVAPFPPSVSVLPGKPLVAGPPKPAIRTIQPTICWP